MPVFHPPEQVVLSWYVKEHFGKVKQELTKCRFPAVLRKSLASLPLPELGHVYPDTLKGMSGTMPLNQRSLRKIHVLQTILL